MRVVADILIASENPVTPISTVPVTVTYHAITRPARIGIGSTCRCTPGRGWSNCWLI